MKFFKTIFSIKYKLMLIMGIVLLCTVGGIVTLSINLIVKDKTTYIYDLNSSVARIYAEKINLTLKNKKANLEHFFNQFMTSNKKMKLSTSFFNRNKDLISITVWKLERYKNNSLVLTRKQSYFNKEYDPAISNYLSKYKKDHPAPLNLLKDKLSLISNNTFNSKFPIFTMTFIPSRYSNIVVTADFTQALLDSFFSQQTDIYDSYIVDASGSLIAHSNPDSNIANQSLEDNILVKRIIARNSVSGVSEYNTNQGEAVLGAYALLKKWGAGIVIEVPKKLAFVGARNLIQNIFTFVLVVCIIAFLLVIFFSRSISKPIINLSEKTKEIAKGKFGTTVNVKSHDEIGQLATDFNTMGQKLDELTKQLIQSTKMASIGSMARSIGHEFGNILGGIIGHADLINMVSSVDEAREKAEIVIEAAERANVIIQNLKGISKSEQTVLDKHSVTDCIDASIVLATPEYNKKGLSIEKDYKGSFTVMMDERQVSQVFLNMLINASHAMDRGGKMKIEVFEKNNFTNILFKDSGKGIPPEIRTKIFEPLFTTKGDKGTGLGLAVSKNIIETHKGTIVVDSEIGEGTTFTIQLPLA